MCPAHAGLQSIHQCAQPELPTLLMRPRKPKRRSSLQGSMTKDGSASPEAALPPYPHRSLRMGQHLKTESPRVSKVPGWPWPTKTASPEIWTQRQAPREGIKRQAETKEASIGKEPKRTS